LIRISLWADGIIHPTLSPYQLLYYTIAYDWLLFGHDLKDRLSKGEEIFFFCFDFLKYIEKDQFSMHKQKLRDDKTSRYSESQSDSSLPDEIPFYFPNVKTSPKNGSPSSIGQSSMDSDPPVFSADILDNQDDSRNNMYVYINLHIFKDHDIHISTLFVILNCIYRNTSGTFHVSPNKESTVQGPRTSPSTNRTSPIGVPIPNNPRMRQRNDSTSSGDSWQLVTGTGSLCGTTFANAPHTEGMSGFDADCKFSFATCTSPRTSLNSEETVVSAQ